MEKDWALAVHEIGDGPLRMFRAIVVIITNPYVLLCALFISDGRFTYPGVLGGGGF